MTFFVMDPAVFVVLWEGEATELNDTKHSMDYNT